MKKVKSQTLLMFFVVITAAICLRAPITSVGSILYCIVEDLQLTNTVAGTITTIPLIVMAVLSPFISKISESYGINSTLTFGLVMMLMGIFLRSFGGVAGLLTGTALIGAGITFGNVLIPAIIKIFFPSKMGMMTGLYTTTMSVCSGIGAGISVPLAVGWGLGWRMTFCIWAVMVLISIIVSVTYIRLYPEQKSEETKKERDLDKTKDVATPLYKIPLAWHMAVMFGGQSCIFYMMTTWLPTIMMDRGISATAAGGVAMVLQIAAIPANFLVPLLTGIFKDQRKLVAVVTGLGIIGLIIIYFAGSSAMFTLGAGLVAPSLGGMFSMSLVMFGMKTKNGAEAARLSGFAQSAGYVMAAIGPFIAGALYDISGNWNSAVIAALFVMILELISGYVVGGGKQI